MSLSASPKMSVTSGPIFETGRYKSHAAGCNIQTIYCLKALVACCVSWLNYFTPQYILAKDIVRR